MKRFILALIIIGLSCIDPVMHSRIWAEDTATTTQFAGIQINVISKIFVGVLFPLLFLGVQTLVYVITSGKSSQAFKFQMWFEATPGTGRRVSGGR